MSSKIFVHSPRRRPKAAAPRPLTIQPEDPERHQARVALERREAERIEADRRRRMLERSAVRVVHAAPTIPKDQSERDADWFAAHPNRNHYVRRKVADEIPAHLDQRRWKWVAIRQLEPGVPIRLPFNLPYTRMFLDLIADEAGSRMVFEMAVEGSLGAAVEEAQGVEGVAP